MPRRMLGNTKKDGKFFCFLGAAMGAKKTSRMERVPSRLLRVIRGARKVNVSWMKIKFPLLKLMKVEIISLIIYIIMDC
jgi:hypothetical protein